MPQPLKRSDAKRRSAVRSTSDASAIAAEMQCPAFDAIERTGRFCASSASA
jgi:hypothetical protein